MADDTQAKAKANASIQSQETLSSSDNSLEKKTETAAEASNTSKTTTTTMATTTTTNNIENNENVSKAVLSTTTTPEFSSSTSLGDQAQQGHGQQPNSLLKPIDSVARALRGSSSEDDTSEWTTIEHASIPQHGDLAQGCQGQQLNKTSTTSTPSSLSTIIPPPSHSIYNNDHHDQGTEMRTHNPLLLNTTPSPVSTNPFRQSPASPQPSSSSSPLPQQSEQLPGVLANVSLSEDPFSLSTNQTTEPETTGPLTRVISGGATGYPTDGVSAVPMGLPPPYLPSPQLASITASIPALIPTSSLSAPSAPSPSPSPSVPSANPPSGSTPPQVKAEYVLKPIDWIDPATGIEKRIKIITQNENGPCPLLALCNTLILQGKVAIKPYNRPSIGYDHLLELLADYLLNEEEPSTATSVSGSAGRVGERVQSEKLKSRFEIESALRLLPHLEHGLDVNVFFKSIRGFEPTSELGLFHTFGVELVHGWVVSPVIDVAMYALVDGHAAITSYNKAVECIVSGDEAGGGLVVETLSGVATPISPSHHGGGAQDAQLQNERISQALVVQEFMNATRTQLTHYGLHELQETLPEGHLCAFFRNNHFCTLFKNPMDGVLYTLVTDQSLAHEQSIVWESLLDVDGAGDFLDGLFRHGTLEVGDYARNNQPIEQQHHLGDGGGDEDFALALQLQQQEEEEEARRAGKRVSTSQLGLENQSGQHYQSGSGSSSGHGHSQQQQQQQQQLQVHQQQQPQLQQQPHQRQFGYETDEEMAARLQQEFMASDQRELQQQQRQQQQQQQRNSQQGISSYDQGHYYPSTSTSPYDPYAQGRPGASQAQAQAYRPPQGQPQNQGHGRIRNSSETSSDKKDKDKCIIS
ncbi:hypothetical protein MVEG_03224 [Podila verticillata NRRL 6337]|nr:hypothetical protein MVEG_03224 [Podila verticillata NRRL 6337]